jgi:hypothetical protein
LNELLGWGQLLSSATICNQVNAGFKSRRAPIRRAFAACKRVPRHEPEEQSSARTYELEKAKRIANAMNALAMICPGPT